MSAFDLVKVIGYKEAEIISYIKDLSKKSDNKTIALCIDALTNRWQLEAVGKGINSTQLIKCLNGKIKDLKKISPILVGLPPDEFQQLLYQCQDEHLSVLSHEAMTEALQHHLTYLMHAIDKQLSQLNQQAETFEQEIHLSEIGKINGHLIKMFKSKIEQINTEYDYYLRLTSNALRLSWNTNRDDLIDGYSKLKDTCLKYMKELIGHPTDESLKATGLHEKLNELYKNVYTDSFLDDDPFMEALAALKLWYLEDHWKVGLLPNIKNSDELQLDPSQHGDEECQEYREKLLNQVAHNLKMMGLNTVKDFKENNILCADDLKAQIALFQKQSSHS